MKKMWILAMSFLCIFLVGCGEDDVFDKEMECARLKMGFKEYNSKLYDMNEEDLKQVTSNHDVFYSKSEKACIAVYSILFVYQNEKGIREKNWNYYIENFFNSNEIFTCSQTKDPNCTHDRENKIKELKK